jgi:hypothetical protein
MDQKRILISEVKNFVKDISEFSPEVINKLRSDFLARNKYYSFQLQSEK